MTHCLVKDGQVVGEARPLDQAKHGVTVAEVRYPACTGALRGFAAVPSSWLQKKVD